jgi:hypothetical protein
VPSFLFLLVRTPPKRKPLYDLASAFARLNKALM